MIMRKHIEAGIVFYQSMGIPEIIPIMYTELNGGDAFCLV